MPESLSAFCNIVSLTAAKTKRMFDVSVACVKLYALQESASLPLGLHMQHWENEDLLRVKIQMCPIDLIESPKQVLRCSVDVVATRVIWKVVSQWRFGQFSAE